MNRFSRLFLAGGQNAVPLSGWFLGGWAPGTLLVVFWFENLVLSLFIAARIAAHWQATRTRGHEGGFLRTFLLTSLAFTLVHGVFLAIVIARLPGGSIVRDEVVKGVQWMLAAQVASLAFDLWRISGWPFAEIRRRTEWVLGRVVAVHLSILVGMFLFMAFDRPAWFFTLFLVPKAMMDLGSLLPQWEPKEPPAVLVRAMNRVPTRKGKGRHDESFTDYWRRTRREEMEQQARDEEVVEGA